VNFAPLFKPGSMAVAGVSLSNDRHPANVIYNKIHLRYPVKVYPVNPKGGIFKRDRVYRGMEEIPGPIDLAVIAVRADLVPETLGQCIRKGAGGAVIISGGFAESGRRDLQERIAAMAREADFPFIGPNCLGIYAPGKFDTFFLPGERLVRPNPGSVGFVSQSGGVLVDQMVKFTEQGLGLSLAVSIGNKALIREIDLLRYLAEDSATKVIAFKWDVLSDASSKHLNVLRELLGLAMQGLRHTQDHLLLLGRKNALERLVAFLLEIDDRTGSRHIIDLAMPRHDIADYLGLTIETVSRTLTLLENEAAIELPTSRRILLRDPAALRRLNA